jgi:hypothetical protein
MLVADSRMIASVGATIRGIDAILDPDVTGGIHDSTTHFLRSPDLELITMGWTRTLPAPQPGWGSRGGGTSPGWPRQRL